MVLAIWLALSVGLAIVAEGMTDLVSMETRKVDLDVAVGPPASEAMVVGPDVGAAAYGLDDERASELTGAVTMVVSEEPAAAAAAVVAVSAEAALATGAAVVATASAMAGTASWTPNLLQKPWAKVRVAGRTMSAVV